MVEKQGAFEDLDNFVADIGNAYRNNMFADFSFILTDGVTISTNRLMLAIRSQYFASMFRENNTEEIFMECDSEIFQLLLDYIWQGRVTFSNLELQQVLVLLENACMMCLERLVENILNYLSHLLDSGDLQLEESWTLLDFCASSSRFEDLLNSVLKFIDLNFKMLTIFSSQENFLKLSADAIFTLLENKSRTVPEVDIFNSLTLWVESQPWPVDSSTKTALLGLVDLVAISPEHLLGVVRKSGLYEDTDICDVLEKQLNIEDEEEVEEEEEKENPGVEEELNRSMRVHIETQEEVEIAFELKDDEEQDYEEEMFDKKEDDEEISGKEQGQKSPSLQIHGKAIMQWLRRRVSESSSYNSI